MAVFNTCFYCNVTLIKQHQNTIAIVCSKCGNLNSPDKKVIPFNLSEEDMSPIRIGTEGKVDGKSFLVTGRVKFNFTAGYRNQWSVTFSDGISQWLSECYGYYAVYAKSSVGSAQSRFKNLNAGNLVEFPDGKKYVVETIRKNRKFTGEGELHEYPSAQTDLFQIELSDENGEIVIVNILEKSAHDIFMGRYYDFDNIAFKKLRTGVEWK